jgi:hypothetical protein
LVKWRLFPKGNGWECNAAASTATVNRGRAVGRGHEAAPSMKADSSKNSAITPVTKVVKKDVSNFSSTLDHKMLRTDKMQAIENNKCYIKCRKWKQ